ncbi:MAG: nucleotidyl transferase AbiEii/AbiGii toxin family protein [Bacteroidales bacterium]|nr:nucleotidyl transferase AbiEii/AbiGii toxin family protein [Bacteroidales bacterium]
MLQVSAVEKNTFGLLTRLMQEPLLGDTRLVGGTSLALQIGHRKSTDLDLFTFSAPSSISGTSIPRLLTESR